MAGSGPSPDIRFEGQRSFPDRSELTSQPCVMPARAPPLWEMLDATIGKAEPQPHPLPTYKCDQRIAWKVLET